MFFTNGACSFALLATVVLVASAEGSPWFCHSVECPGYSVIEKSAKYEVRQYAASTWVSTIVEGYGYDEAVSMGFMKLFKYIGGKNIDGVSIDMTAPVRILVTPGEGPFCKSEFTISFFVPAKNQKDPPAPDDASVYIEDSDPATYYVSQYGGYTSESKVIKHAFSLEAELAKKGIKVHTDQFYTAGYDPPFRIFYRHNEVWLKAKESGHGPGMESLLAVGSRARHDAELKIADVSLGRKFSHE